MPLHRWHTIFDDGVAGATSVFAVLGTKADLLTLDVVGVGGGGGRVRLVSVAATRPLLRCNLEEDEATKVLREGCTRSCNSCSAKTAKWNNWSVVL